MPRTRPPSIPQLVGAVAATIAASALLLLWLILRPPPVPYRTAIAVAATIAVVVGAVIIIAGLVRLVESRFERRYDAAEAAAATHREHVEVYLASIDELAQLICRQQKQLRTRVERCVSEVGVVSDGLDELRQAFVEEGLPIQRR